MKRNFFSRVLIASVFLACSLCAQDSNNPKRDSPAFSAVASGATLTIDNWRGDGNQSFEYIINGAPATSSIVLSGCMRGGTCETIETYAVVANSIRNYSGPKVYDTFTVVPTFTGGTNPSLTVNRTAVKQSTGVFMMGFLKTVTVSNPAAGADISTAVPAGKVWRLVSIQGKLVTSATVANRTVRWSIDDGANVFYAVDANFTQAASLTETYSAGFGIVSANSNTFAISPFPGVLLLPAGFRINTVTTAIQATDQWSAITLLVEEFDR